MRQIDSFGKSRFTQGDISCRLTWLPFTGMFADRSTFSHPESGNIKLWLADTIPHLFYILEALRCEKDSENDDELLLDAEERNLWRRGNTWPASLFGLSLTTFIAPNNIRSSHSTTLYQGIFIQLICNCKSNIGRIKKARLITMHLWILKFGLKC